MNDGPFTVSYGGGTNSTAMLVGLLERGEKPDLITFADTGAEMPHTYEHLNAMQSKVNEWWGMEIVIAKATYNGVFESLTDSCLRKKVLPSLAYGRKACSLKHKVEPQEKIIAKWMKDGGLSSVVTCIGYDANEGHRRLSASSKEIRAGKLVSYRYPLVEWQWRREECVQAICRHGLSQPGKSACFFCPASKPSEVLRLAKNHPDLMQTALEIEAGAQPNMKQYRGLGGENNLWANWLEKYGGQTEFTGLDLEPMHAPCGCFDQ